MVPKISILLVVFVLAIGCKEEKDTCDLSGKWFFNKVIRNEKYTNTLQDGYFEFKDGNKFVSNLFDEGHEYQYNVNGKSVSIQAEEDFSLDIAMCNKDTLLLQGVMSHFDMQFLLTRTKKIDSLDLRSVNPMDMKKEGEGDQLY